MLEKDLEVLEKILISLGFSTNYISIVLTYLVNKLEDTSLESFTPSFLYTLLSPEIGKSNSRDVADYFEQYQITGTFKTKLQDLLDKSPWMK